MRKVRTITHGPSVCEHCNGTGKIEHSSFTRVDIEGTPTLSDLLARVIANHKSPAPGRLALSQSDCDLADEITTFLKERGLLPGEL